MKKKIANILLIIMVLCFILSIKTSVLAESEYSGKFSLISSQTNLKEGDIFEVDIKIDSLTGFSGIKSFIAKKNFNSEVFEYQGAEGKNGWEVKGDNVKVVIKRDTDIGSGVIATLKFKVLKVDLNATIQLTELDASGEDGDVYFDDNNVNEPSITLKIENGGSTEPTEPSNPTEPTEPSNPTEPTNPTNPTNPSDKDQGSTGTKKPTANDKTTATTKMPQTGESNIVIVLISLVAVVAGVLFVRYKVYSKDIK